MITQTFFPNRVNVATSASGTRLANVGKYGASKTSDVFHPRFSGNWTDDKWPRNTRVLTSCKAEEVEATARDPIIGMYGYLSTLIEALEDSDGVVEAHSRINKVTLRDASGNEDHMHPSISQGNAVGWRKSHVQTPRQLLFIQGYAPESHKLYASNEDIEKEVAYAKEKFVSAFDLNAEQARVLKQPSIGDIKTEFQKLAEYAKENPNAELLLVLRGHGSLIEKQEPSKGLLGKLLPVTKRTGTLTLRDMSLFKAKNVKDKDTDIPVLPDYELKRLCAEYLAPFKNVTIIVAACHSGVWDH